MLNPRQAKQLNEITTASAPSEKAKVLLVGFAYGVASSPPTESSVARLEQALGRSLREHDICLRLPDVGACAIVRLDSDRDVERVVQRLRHSVLDRMSIDHAEEVASWPIGIVFDALEVAEIDHQADFIDRVTSVGAAAQSAARLGNGTVVSMSESSDSDRLVDEARVLGELGHWQALADRLVSLSSRAELECIAERIVILAIQRGWIIRTAAALADHYPNNLPELCQLLRAEAGCRAQTIATSELFSGDLHKLTLVRRRSDIRLWIQSAILENNPFHAEYASVSALLVELDARSSLDCPQTCFENLAAGRIYRCLAIAELKVGHIDSSANAFQRALDYFKSAGADDEILWSELLRSGLETLLMPPDLIESSTWSKLLDIIAELDDLFSERRVLARVAVAWLAFAKYNMELGERLLADVDDIDDYEALNNVWPVVGNLHRLVGLIPTIIESGLTVEIVDDIERLHELLRAAPVPLPFPAQYFAKLALDCGEFGLATRLFNLINLKNEDSGVERAIYYLLRARLELCCSPSEQTVRALQEHVDRWRVNSFGIADPMDTVECAIGDCELMGRTDLAMMLRNNNESVGRSRRSPWRRVSGSRSFGHRRRNFRLSPDGGVVFEDGNDVLQLGPDEADGIGRALSVRLARGDYAADESSSVIEKCVLAASEKVACEESTTSSWELALVAWVLGNADWWDRYSERRSEWLDHWAVSCQHSLCSGASCVSEVLRDAAGMPDVLNSAKSVISPWILMDSSAGSVDAAEWYRRNELDAVYVLGDDLRVVRHGASVSISDCSARMLGVLVCRRRPVTAEWLMEQLWPDIDPDVGRDRIKVLTYRIRKSLQLSRSELLVRSSHGFSLSAQGWLVDLWAFQDFLMGTTVQNLLAFRWFDGRLVSRQFAYDDAFAEARRETVRLWRNVGERLVRERVLPQEEFDSRCDFVARTEE